MGLAERWARASVLPTTAAMMMMMMTVVGVVFIVSVRIETTALPEHRMDEETVRLANRGATSYLAGRPAPEGELKGERGRRVLLRHRRAIMVDLLISERQKRRPGESFWIGAQRNAREQTIGDDNRSGAAAGALPARRKRAKRTKNGPLARLGPRTIFTDRHFRRLSALAPEVSRASHAGRVLDSKAAGRRLEWICWPTGQLRGRALVRRDRAESVSEKVLGLWAPPTGRRQTGRGSSVSGCTFASIAPHFLLRAPRPFTFGAVQATSGSGVAYGVDRRHQIDWICRIAPLACATH
jgi:hypothetical protein